MSEIKEATVQVLIEVTDEYGNVTPEIVDLDLDLSNPTLQESVIWEEEFGEAELKKMLAGGIKIDTPKKVRALLYARLKIRHKDLKIGDFDLDYEAIHKALSE